MISTSGTNTHPACRRMSAPASSSFPHRQAVLGESCESKSLIATVCLLVVSLCRPYLKEEAAYVIAEVIIVLHNGHTVHPLLRQDSAGLRHVRRYVHILPALILFYAADNVIFYVNPRTAFDAQPREQHPSQHFHTQSQRCSDGRGCIRPQFVLIPSASLRPSPR